jgi:hypothetical protein
MSHKKTADDNPQINLCGYPLNLLSESGFQKTLFAISALYGDKEGFGLVVTVAGVKNANRFGRSPSKGIGRLPENDGESTNFLKKIKKVLAPPKTWSPSLLFYDKTPPSVFYKAGGPRPTHAWNLARPLLVCER